MGRSGATQLISLGGASARHGPIHESTRGEGEKSIWDCFEILSRRAFNAMLGRAGLPAWVWKFVQAKAYGGASEFFCFPKTSSITRLL